MLETGITQFRMPPNGINHESASTPRKQKHPITADTRQKFGNIFSSGHFIFRVREGECEE
jgi:hypothetical protein